MAVDFGDLDRKPPPGVGARVYCNRVNKYMSRADCIYAYEQALKTETGGYCPCLECSKVRLWAESENQLEAINKNKSKQVKTTAKSSTAKKPVEHVSPVSGCDNNQVCIDFTDYMELMDVLNGLAKKNFRTPGQQVLSMIQNHIYGKKSHKTAAV